jgi:hypothetical protein
MNAEDFDQFQRLSKSRIRSEEREEALKTWDSYKRSRQLRYTRHDKPSSSLLKRGVWTKGDYIRSLTAPAIDLRGARLTDVCVGYVDLRGVRLDRAIFDHDKRSWIALKGALLESASLRDVHLPEARRCTRIFVARIRPAPI